MSSDEAELSDTGFGGDGFDAGASSDDGEGAADESTYLSAEDGAEDSVDDAQPDDGEGEDADEDNIDEDMPKPGEAMADAMARILGKSLDARKSTILSKSSQADQRIEERQSRKRKQAELRAKKERRDQDRVLPDATPIAMESKLKRIATRGAVALFNAVRKQQTLENEDDQPASGGIGGKDVKSMDKKEFLGLLSKKARVDRPEKKAKTSAAEPTGNGDGDGGWKVLQDSFMLESKAEDWQDGDDNDSEADDNGNDGAAIGDESSEGDSE